MKANILWVKSALQSLSSDNKAKKPGGGGIGSMLTQVKL